jgi:hypothetical protein
VAKPKGTPNKRKSVAVKRTLLTAIRNGNTLATAATLAGITYDTLKRWRRLDPPFNTVVLQAEAEAEVKHVNNIGLAGKINWQASAWWLERRRTGDWRKPADRLEATIDHRKDAEAIAAEIGKADDPAVIAQIEKDLLISQEASR